ncbi:MAG: aminoacyl--tRNA ligase-related protein, partial [Candidatus Micrarchaeota archaeon]
MDMAQREFNIDKEKDFSGWYNTIIYAAELADIRYNVKGFVVNRPWAMMSFKKIYALFEKALEKDGHLPILFPTVIPEENFEKEKEHVEGFSPEVLWVTRAGKQKLERPLALRPTSETAFYQMYKLWISSYKDLPYKLYQSCSVFRNESET